MGISRLTVGYNELQDGELLLFNHVMLMSTFSPFLNNNARIVFLYPLSEQVVGRKMPRFCLFGLVPMLVSTVGHCVSEDLSI